MPVAPPRAFELFAGRFADWWPQDYTFSRGALDMIAIEPEIGGRCIERDRDGEETVWGRVRVWAPAEHLAFAWHIGPDSALIDDDAKASLVDVRFTPTGDGRTRIDLAHRDFANHGAGWETYLSQMKSEYGWPLCLGRYRDLADGEGKAPESPAL